MAEKLHTSSLTKALILKLFPKYSPPSGHIRFTDVGPHSVRLEWGDPDVAANGRQKFQIEWKNEEKDYTKTTHENHF